MPCLCLQASQLARRDAQPLDGEVSLGRFLVSESFGKGAFVIYFSCPFKDVNRKPIVVARGVREWFSHGLLNGLYGWHEPRVRHD